MEVNSFLQDCPPFDTLAEEQRSWAVSQLQSVYMNDQNCNDILKDMKPALFIVRSGVFDLRGADGRLIERLESGDYLAIHLCYQAVKWLINYRR